MSGFEQYNQGMAPNFAAMGLFLDAWDHVEGACSMLFEALVSHPMSQRIFFSSSSFSSKSKLLERCLEVAPATTRFVEIEKVMKRATKFSGRRNDIVHGLWVLIAPGQSIRVAIRKDHDDTAAVCAAYMQKNNQKLADRAYTAERMTNMAIEMQELSMEIMGLANLLFAEQKAKST